MEWLALLIPIFISLLAFYIFRGKLTWWEIALPTALTIIVILTMKYFMFRSAVVDTEYYSNHIVSVTHYDAWDEWIDRTCSSTDCDSKGNNCKTTYYDCSYRENHPEYWQAELNNGNRYNISKEYFDQLVSRWNNLSFVEMNRDYYRIDGDAQRSFWNNNFNTVEPYDSEGTYFNKPQTAETMFYFNSLSKEEVKQVYEYPYILENNQKSCIGCNDYENLVLRRMNSINGKAYQIKIFVLVFKNKPVSIAELQRRFWKNGNKNELVVCMDSESRWAKSFSWQDNKLLESKTNSIFSDKDLSIKEKLIELNKIIPSHWKRKSFSDFDYIEVQLKPNQQMWIFIVAFIMTGITIAWGIFNKIE